MTTLTTTTGFAGAGWIRTVAWGVAIAVGGVVCVVVPVLVSGKPMMPAPLFPLLRTGVEGLSWHAPLLLVLLGVGAGWLTRWWPLSVGLCSVAVFPVAAVAEIFKDSTSHNLIPFELIMYLFLSLPAMAGAWMGGMIGRLVRGRTGTKTAGER